MYRILLVTDQNHLLTVFEEFADWQALGFDPPLLLTDVQAAMQHVQGGEVQAVSYALPKEAGQAFYAFMAGFPGIRGMEAASDPARLRRAVSSLRRQLREGEQEEPGADVIALMQQELFHAMISGASLTEPALRARIQALGLPTELNTPLAVARLSLPEDQDYIDQVWRYGRERLKIALHNFFDRDLMEARFVVDMLSLGEIKLMLWPKLPMGEEKMLELFYDHLTCAREEVKLYLDLGMQVQWVKVFDSLPAMARGQEGRTVYRT